MWPHIPISGAGDIFSIASESFKTGLNQGNCSGGKKPGIGDYLMQAGWRMGAIPLYVKRLLNFGKSGESCRRVHSFENPAADFFDSLRRSGSPHFFKNNAYLNWRYSHHPTNQYSSFTYEEEGKLKGILVLRDLNIRKRRFLVIMELLGNEQSTFRSLLGQAVFEASKLKIPWLAYLGNAFERSWMLRRGFFPVPAWIQPKRQLLMGTVAGMGNQDIFKRAWSVQTGDWDGF